MYQSPRRAEPSPLILSLLTLWRRKYLVLSLPVLVPSEVGGKLKGARLEGESLLMILYKYLHPDRIDVLEGGQIRFTQPSVLNDPFELRPNFEAARVALLELVLDGDHERRHVYNDWCKINEDILKEENLLISYEDIKLDLKDEIERLLIRAVDNLFEVQIYDLFDRRHLILSLSKRPDSRLMWSHYACEHRGFSVGFDQEMLQVGLRERLTVLKPASVRYSDKRYVVPGSLAASCIAASQVMDERDNCDENTPPLSDVKAVMTRILLTKSSDWKYEDEVRFFAPVERATSSGKRDVMGATVHLFDFPPESVVRVTLGCKAAPSLKEEIYKVVSTQYPKASIDQAVISPTTFDMEIVSVSSP